MTRASELRDAFDRGFAMLPPPEPAHSDVLCIRAAGQPWAIPLGDIASLHADVPIVALPTRAVELLGVATVRAAIVPIYDLAAVLDSPSTGAPRWVVVIRRAVAGFAFEGNDGHARIPDRSIAGTLRGHLRGHFTLGEQARSILDLGSMLTAIEARWRPSGAAKEG